MKSLLGLHQAQRKAGDGGQLAGVDRSRDIVMARESRGFAFRLVNRVGRLAAIGSLSIREEPAPTRLVRAYLSP